MPGRLQRVEEKLRERKLEGFLVTHLPHVRYLTGFSGSAGLCLIGSGKRYFLTDYRYQQQSREEVKGFKILIAPNSLVEEIERRKLFRGMRNVGIEGNYIPYSEYQKFKKTFSRVRFTPQANVIESVSVVKDEGEIGFIKRAARISDNVFQQILDILRPGVRESEISAEISYLQKLAGAERDAFDTIVASGPRGALPHGLASNKKIRKGEFVTLDFGCVYRGYCCDITRTVAVGRPGGKLRHIYEIVHDAQSNAIEAATTGVVARELDAVARGYIEKSGFGKYFGHSLGHGIGLQVHESPRISSQSSYRLQHGNVITIEPGIYLPGIGGVRIEDDVVIMNGKSLVLNKAPKELLVL